MNRTEMLPTEDYDYRPLDDPEDCIRLLKLVPTSTDHADDLWGELITCRRTDAPPYRPVSYTWGQQDASSTIFLREGGDVHCGCFKGKTGSQSSPRVVFQQTTGTDLFSILTSRSTELDFTIEECTHTEWRRFSIRPNLETFLRRLRGIAGSKTFWIDAICINQKDNHEKAYQVRNMDKVYRGKELLIWLGESSENSDAAVKLIRELQIRYLMQDTAEETWDFITSRAHMTTLWKALLDLIKRPWFTRRWIVQEFVLSSYKHAYLGNDDFAFQFLYFVCTLLQKTLYYLDEDDSQDTMCRETVNLPNGISHPFPAPVLDPIQSLRRLFDISFAASKGDNESLRLERLLDSFASFESYDPRDGIYAFLSMASDVDRGQWLPDYSENNTVTDLYGRAVLHIVRSTSSLDIICRRVQGPTSEHPSHWIPWFGPQKVEWAPGHVHSVHGYNTKSLTTFGLPVAALRVGHPGYSPKVYEGRLLQFSFCDGCHKKIEGTGYKCLDCPDFDYCYRCIGNSDANHDSTHTFEVHNKSVYFASGRKVTSMGGPARFRPCKESGTGNFVPLKTPGFLVDTVKGIGRCGRMSRKRGNIAGSTIPWANWMSLPGMKEIGLDEAGRPRDTLLRALTGNRRVCGGRVCHMPNRYLQLIRQMLEQPTSTLQDRGDMAYSFEMIMSSNRAFATTEKSLGFVPVGTEVEDRIAILVGCSVPVVLRYINSDSSGATFWLFVGECYIEGLMDGEYLDVIAEEHLSPQALILF